MSVSLGDVLHLRCNLCNPPKNKFFVVVLVDPLKTFLINSRLTDFQIASPAHQAAMARIRATQHDFLDYDSVIACDHLSHEYDHETVERLLLEEPRRFVGQLHADARVAIAEALHHNKLLAGKYLKRLKEVWRQGPEPPQPG